MDKMTSKGLASTKILILWNTVGNHHHSPWIPWWQLQVWGHWYREQMPRLWIASLKPASSEYETREWALILDKDGLADSAPNSLGSGPWGAAALVSGQASQHHHGAPRLPPALSSPDTSKVQAAGIFRVFTTSAKTEGEDLKQVWVIFRTLSIQRLLCSRREDTIIPASFLMYHRLEQATSSRKGDQARKNYLPTPPLLFCHNNSFNFWGGGGKSGLLLWILEGCWVFRFRYAPRSQSGERIRVSNYSSHPRTQCSASHILTISKTRETTHTPTEYFCTHWKPHTKWKVIKQFGLKFFFYFEFMSSTSLSSLSYKICKFYNATSKVH